jgi:hypothetical protein
MLGPVRTVRQESRVAWKVMEINLHNSVEKVFTCQEDHSYSQVAEKIPQTYSCHKYCAKSRNSYNSILTPPPRVNPNLPTAPI